MNPRARTLLGALALCALSICAFAAASASAAGLTAVECVELPNGGKYNTSQCLTPGTPGNWETVVIAGKQAVEGKATRTIPPEEGAGHALGNTTKPVVVIHSTIAGIEVTTTCGAATFTGGTVENKEEAGEMKIHKTQTKIRYKECHVSPKTKPTKICTIQGVAPETPVGEMESNNLTSITGPEHKVTVKPEVGETFTKYKINASGGECFTAAPIEVTVTGELEGEVNTTTHSHLTFNEANGGNKTKANGNLSRTTTTVTTFTKGTTILVGAETF